MSPVLLGLGTNIGDRATNLEAAVMGLRRLVTVTAASPVYETAPMYDTDQPAFLNQVVVAETDLAPAALLHAVKGLERQLGRVATRRHGPRAIDIDILLYGDQVVREPGLEIPHPGLPERGFVLVPAADVAPGWRHPVTGLTVEAMRQRLGAVEGLRRFAPESG